MGRIFCTASIDKLGQLAYKNADLLYLFKRLVAVPPVSMVDDILCIQKKSDSRNAFIALKKLTLSNRKCRRVYILVQHFMPAQISKSMMTK